MENRPTEKRVSFLIVIFFCLVMGTSALTLVNYFNDSEIETTVKQQEQRIKQIEKELEKNQKTDHGAAT